MAWAIKIYHAIGNVAVGSSGHRPGFMSMAPSASYAVAELPSAGSHGAGAMVLVTNIPSGLRWPILMAPIGAAFIAALSLLKHVSRNRAPVSR